MIYHQSLAFKRFRFLWTNCVKELQVEKFIFIIYILIEYLNKRHFVTTSLLFMLVLSHTWKHAACVRTSSKEWASAPPSILYTLLHCLFKPHIVTKAGCVCLWVRDGELEESAILAGRVITAYHQTACPVASRIIVPSLAGVLAGLMSTREAQTFTINKKYDVQ